MHLCLFEDAQVQRLEPLVSTRPAFDLRVGARTLLETAAARFPHDQIGLFVRSAVAEIAAEDHPDARVVEAGSPALFLNACWLVQPGATFEAVHAAIGVGEPRAFYQGERLVALWQPQLPHAIRETSQIEELAEESPETHIEDGALITHLWDLIRDLDARIAADIEDLGRLGENHGAVHPRAVFVSPERIHLAEGSRVDPSAVLDATTGPIRLDRGVRIGAGAVINGPCWIGPDALIHPHARVEASAIGERSKIGGEVHGSVFHSFSNKAHDGYIGSSYIGQWCNLGAGTNNSNLKNNYGTVRLFDPVAQAEVDSGMQFLGLIMGDHSKSAINSMFNTGTVVGVSCNIFGNGFPPRHIHSFSWGGPDGIVPYRTVKALEVAERVMARRDRKLTDAQRTLLTEIGNTSSIHGERYP